MVDTVCDDILNKFRVGADGHTAYERITSHACKVAQIGFAEVVDFKLETDKNNRNKADSEFNEGVFLGYAWRSTEYLIASKGAIYKCRTVRRRADDIAFNVALIDHLEVRLKTTHLRAPRPLCTSASRRSLGEMARRRFPLVAPAWFLEEST